MIFSGGAFESAHIQDASIATQIKPPCGAELQMRLVLRYAILVDSMRNFTELADL